MQKFHYFKRGAEKAPSSYLFQQKQQAFASFSQRQRQFIDDFARGLAASVALSAYSLAIGRSREYVKEYDFYPTVYYQYDDPETYGTYSLDEELTLIKEITNFKLAQNTVLFRALRKSEFDNRLRPNHKLFAHLSTSTNEEIEDNIAKQNENTNTIYWLMTIYAHKGVRGLFIGKQGIEEINGDQAEYILAPGNYYRILKRGRGLEMEVFPSKSALENAEPVDSVDTRIFGRTWARVKAYADTLDAEYTRTKALLKWADSLIGKKVPSKKRGDGIVRQYRVNESDRMFDLNHDFPFTKLKFTIEFDDRTAEWEDVVMASKFQGAPTMKPTVFEEGTNPMLNPTIDDEFLEKHREITYEITERRNHENEI